MSFRAPYDSDEEQLKPKLTYTLLTSRFMNLYLRVGRTSQPKLNEPETGSTSVLKPASTTSGSEHYESAEEPEALEQTEPTTHKFELEGPEPLVQSIIIKPIFEPRPSQYTTSRLLPEPLKPEPRTTTPQTTEMMTANEPKSYLKKPEPFDGDRCKVDNFINECDLFFEGSPTKDFPEDKMKIIFILLYMSNGEARRWRKDYIETKVRKADGSYDWLTKANFLKDFKAAFLNEDEKEQSIQKLDHISQGNQTAEEYVNKFQLTVSKAKLKTDNDMMVQTF
ncbi:hypothetical protein M413DRAFT_24283 [Hebeloma cylindrosporum]|uniref:Ty3 transposon capsid-like protein domain-containing protein n=1 Tax=Hebeloma cylindrosporum TaxID=76867 RepID=A0A0C3CML7_HEBCY|nr:hypothetical protein M413DRAFT_24283 [Hebeloma cylindrosporum h7]